MRQSRVSRALYSLSIAYLSLGVVGAVAGCLMIRHFEKTKYLGPIKRNAGGYERPAQGLWLVYGWKGKALSFA